MSEEKNEVVEQLISDVYIIMIHLNIGEIQSKISKILRIWKRDLECNVQKKFL